MSLHEIMTSDVVSVVPDATVKEATRALDEHRVTALPVVDPAGRLIGVVSEADVLRDVVACDRVRRRFRRRTRVSPPSSG